MDDSAAWSALPKRWLHIQLPNYRSLPEPHTYEGSSLDELPSIPIELDDNCEWLITHGTTYAHGALNEYERDIQPTYIESLADRDQIKLPRSFRRFMTSPELQSRVRSCTDCYLDPGERVVRTVGSIPGHLIHFLSDSQSCAHWYLHILPNGSNAVLESPDLYCYKPEHSDWMENPACRLEYIDVSQLEFAYCVPTFSDFLYRFWIENEIWFVLEHLSTRSELNALELAYVGHYAALKPRPREQS